MEVAKDRIKTVRLVNLAQEFGLRREVLPDRIEIRAVGKAGEKLGGTTRSSCQMMEPLGEGVAAGEFRIHRKKIGDHHTEKSTALPPLR